MLKWRKAEKLIPIDNETAKLKLDEKYVWNLI